MKTSPGLLLGVLFTLVVVIVAVVIYFNTRPGEEKPGTSTGPSSTLPSIGDLTIAQTLSPNSNSETYTIEPYTIEYSTPEEAAPAAPAAVYDEGDIEKSLSRNVTFTLNWTNRDGFETVSKIEVEHYIRGIDDVLRTVVLPESTRTDDGSWNYADISVVVTGLPDGNDDQYSFVGENMFKIVATNNNLRIPLYDGTADLVDGATHPPELVVKSEDLTATIGMTQSRTVTFDVSLLEDTRTTTKDIQNTSYTFTATTIPDSTGTTRDISISGIEFISQDTTGTEFKFKNKGTNTYLGVNKDTETGALTLNKNASEGDAAIITFAKSFGKSDDYRMFKTVVTEPSTTGGTDVETEYYLYGPHIANDTTIKWLTLFNRVSSQAERVMKDWRVDAEE